ncbi:MAG: hypothetical protein K0S56_3277 [Microvirga sp.]|jgi:Zn-finger nucleic acid-binding protein|nr:hypothetical protein [Microvirga sp.]
MTNAAAGMPCPVCRVPLLMSERQGVEVDYCPQCRGVWLDRGELDKILERNAQETQSAAPASPPRFSQPEAAADYRGDSGQAYGQPYGKPYGHGHHKRKKSFLEELFD